MTTLFKKSQTSAIFELILDDQTVYMSASCTNYMNDVRYVVVVDAVAFVTLWRNEPSPLSRDLNFGDKVSWKKDKKFPDAEIGFSFGQENPVPLAKGVCYINPKNNLPYIAMDNGITRTIWLLSNGVKYFPLECRNQKEAQSLVKYAGYKSTDIIAIKELLECS